MTGLVQLDIVPDAVEDATIIFSEWLPDLPTVNNPGNVEALNVIPAEGSYAPFSQLEPQLLAVLADPARGAISVISVDDTVQIYAGTVNGLFTRIGDTAFSNLLTVPVNDDTTWKFIRVGEQMVALHSDVIPRKTPVGTLTAAVVVGGTPPRAACGAQVGDFLMLGNLLSDPDDGGNPFPSRVRWGGFNNIDQPWVTNPATQADFQDMPAEGGPVVAIAGREVGTIFQARMISRATYRGPPQIFDIQIIEDKRGAIARDCIVDVGAYSFFIAEDGFFVWNGTNSSPIGDSRVNSYFFKRLQYSRRSRIVGAADFINGCVMWAFPTDSTGSLNEIIIYSYRDNRFTHSIQTIEYLFSSAASNVTLDELTEPLENYDYSFDDPSLRSGGRARLAAFNSLHTYGLFTGLPMAATIDTGEYSGPNGRRAFVNGVRPQVDLTAPMATCQAITRDQLMGQSVEFGTPVAQELHGWCPLLADARYLRLRTNIPADVNWTHAVGVEVTRKATGVF